LEKVRVEAFADFFQARFEFMDMLQLNLPSICPWWCAGIKFALYSDINGRKKAIIAIDGICARTRLILPK
jgi:hypothetical protein